MMKLYLLIAGYNYYPSHRTGDWIDTFETYDEALKEVGKSDHYHSSTGVKIRGEHYDWYEIVDLKEWIFKK